MNANRGLTRRITILVTKEQEAQLKRQASARQRSVCQHVRELVFQRDKVTKRKQTKEKK